MNLLCPGLNAGIGHKYSNRNQNSFQCYFIYNRVILLPQSPIYGPHSVLIGNMQFIIPFDLRQFEINASLQFFKGIQEGFKGIFSTLVGLITDWSCTLFRLKIQQEIEYDSLFIGCFIFFKMILQKTIKKCENFKQPIN